MKKKNDAITDLIVIMQTYDVFVTGIDLSANMISIALEKAAAYNDPRVSIKYDIYCSLEGSSSQRPMSSYRI